MEKKRQECEESDPGANIFEIVKQRKVIFRKFDKVGMVRLDQLSGSEKQQMFPLLKKYGYYTKSTWFSIGLVVLYFIIEILAILYINYQWTKVLLGVGILLVALGLIGFYVSIENDLRSGHKYNKSHCYYMAVLMTLVFLCSSLSEASAQQAKLPHSGIYKVNSENNFLSLSDYAHQIKYGYYGVHSYQINVLPYPILQKNQLEYALVAVDTLNGNGIFKIAFLQDSTATAKNVAASSEESMSYFSQEFEIKQGKIASQVSWDLYFPSSDEIEGKWLVSPDGDEIALLKQPKRQALSEDSLAYTFYQSTLNTTPPGMYDFKDIRYTYAKGNIPVYAKANKTSTVKTHLQAHEYYAILKDSLNWDLIMRPVVLPDTQTYYSMDGGAYKNRITLQLNFGWVNEADFVQNPWVKQTQETKKFRFEVSGSYDADNFPNASGEVDAIKIINKKTKRVQLLTRLSAPLFDSLKDVVQIEDDNFDGYPDISFLAQTGGAGPNDAYNFYLYNPENGQFEYNETLSGLTQITIDSKTKTISSAFRDGCCHHGGATYTFVKGKMDTLSIWDNAWNYAGLFGEVAKSRKVNGKWRDSLNYEGMIQADSALLYSAANTDSKSIARLKNQDIVVVLKQNPLWLKVSTSADRHHQYEDIIGWIKKQAILPAIWKPVKTTVGDYQFELSVNDTGKGSGIYAVKVIRKNTGKMLQIIPLFQNIYDRFSDSVLQTGDFLNNGTVGFRIRHYQQEKITSYSYYFYNKRKGIFEEKTNFHSQNGKR